MVLYTLLQAFDISERTLERKYRIGWKGQSRGVLLCFLFQVEVLVSSREDRQLWFYLFPSPSPKYDQKYSSTGGSLCGQAHP